MDPKSKKLRKVAVLLDTGAELSFIDNSLAEELGLPTLEETTLRLHTFSSEQIQEELCRKVPLETWDEEGNPISLQLLTHRILTKSLVPPPVLEEDLEYIRRMNLPIRLNERQLCVCHQNRNVQGWTECWSLDARVNVISTDDSSDIVDEKELWARYWSLEAAGTEQYTESEKSVQSVIDKRVWGNFRQTVERRDDGYYVRLSWKELSTPSPDNKAIAYRRLEADQKDVSSEKNSCLRLSLHSSSCPTCECHKNLSYEALTIVAH
ncbi:hypothetical protein NECAME_00774 [Necator americanus]|uniref:Peptidase aspartic putative domain-containing protein n=1 Tax=Necator americanus TaxID=51031 RepID=W2SVK5_NECAM|nr:hypothetical protein NECAME_00774 [Necator americanus]ETN73685.1 hypothetical protein NECAME_00774 [Necator americanus]